MRGFSNFYSTETVMIWTIAFIQSIILITHVELLTKKNLLKTIFCGGLWPRFGYHDLIRIIQNAASVSSGSRELVRAGMGYQLPTKCKWIFKKSPNFYISVKRYMQFLGTICFNSYHNELEFLAFSTCLNQI